MITKTVCLGKGSNESYARYCKRETVQHDTADQSKVLVMIVERRIREQKDPSSSGNKKMCRQTIASMVILEDHASLSFWKHLMTSGYIGSMSSCPCAKCRLEAGGPFSHRMLTRRL